MKTIIMTIAAVAAVHTGLAYNFDPEAYEPVPRATKAEIAKMTKEQLDEYHAGRKLANLHRNGGIIRIAAKGKLLVAVVNGCATTNQLARCLGQVDESLQINAEVVQMKDDGFGIDRVGVIMKERDAQIALFIVDSPTLPASLHADEEGWTIVNVAKMRAGSPTEEKLDLRIRKLIARGFMAAVGSCSDADETSPMRPAPTVNELDKIPVAHISFWNVRAMIDYLKTMGVFPMTLMPYRRAVQAGIAPAPTNKWQKLIWEKEHEIPTKPMQIKFDHKADK